MLCVFDRLIQQDCEIGSSVFYTNKKNKIIYRYTVSAFDTSTLTFVCTEIPRNQNLLGAIKQHSHYQE